MKLIPIRLRRAAASAPALCAYAVLIVAAASPAARGEVVCLKDGNCVAGTSAAPLDGLFLRLHTLEGVRDLERSDILLHRKDGELRTMLHAAREAVEPGDGKGLVQLAWWCRQKGLYEDMFSLYDAALTLDPEDPDVGAFIAEMAGVIDFGPFEGARQLSPESAAELLRTGAGEGPTLARIRYAVLLHVPDPVLVPLLLEAINSRRGAERILALRILQEKLPRDALEPLVESALFHRDSETRSLSLDALVRYGEPRVLNPFIAALRLQRREYRFNAMDGLLRLNDPRASGALIANLAPADLAPAHEGGGATRAHIFSGTQTAAVTGFDTEVATGAAIASPIVSTLQEGAVLDVKVFGAAVYTIRQDERARIGQILRDLTGIDYGTDYVLWKEWWEQNKPRLLARER